MNWGEKKINTCRRERCEQRLKNRIAKTCSVGSKAAHCGYSGQSMLLRSGVSRAINM